MKTYGINRSLWATELRVLLRGELTNLAMSLSPDQLNDYDILKDRLLAHLGESRSSQFHDWLHPKINSVDTVSQVAYRIAEASRASTKDCKTKEEILELVNCELVFRQLHPRVTTHRRAQKPANLQELMRIADQYIADSARGRESGWSKYAVNQHPQANYPKSSRPDNNYKNVQQYQPPRLRPNLRL